MIIHKLIAQHLKHCDDAGFYLMQAQDAIAWLEKRGVAMTPATRALDLGCGHGIFGFELRKKGCRVVFADEENYLMPELAGAEFHRFNIDAENPARLGTFDLVICSNVYEHLSKPREFLEKIPAFLQPGGFFYLSWTNWLSPWGGHEFSPWHYLGPRLGPKVFDRLTGKKRKHTPYVNLFPTAIGETLRLLNNVPGLRVAARAPRYYPELALLTRVPLLREFLTWNCAILLQRTGSPPPSGERA